MRGVSREAYKHRLVALPFPAETVRCAAGYTIAITKMHTLYSWGINTYGQLGLGRSHQSKPTTNLGAS